MNVVHLPEIRTHRALTQTIERIRHQLVQVVNEKESFTDDEIVTLSQQLDNYLLTVQREMYAKRSMFSTEYQQSKGLNAESV